jgi:hypothetical protein
MTSTPISAGDRLRGVLARSDRVSEQPRRPKEALLLAFLLLIQPPPSPDLSLIMKFTSIAALAALAATVQARQSLPNLGLGPSLESANVSAFLPAYSWLPCKVLV